MIIGMIYALPTLFALSDFTKILKGNLIVFMLKMKKPETSKAKFPAHVHKGF